MRFISLFWLVVFLGWINLGISSFNNLHAQEEWAPTDPSYLDSLPDEMKLEILSHLDAQSLMKMGQTDSNWMGLSQESDFKNDLLDYKTKKITSQQNLISSGPEFTCAILKDQSISCWGVEVFTPKIPKGIRATSISVGNLHVCAILEDQTLECWGGFVKDFFPSEKIRALAVSAREHSVCAVLLDHTVTCWVHEIGARTNLFPHGMKAIAIANGAHEVCAILEDHSISCLEGFDWLDQFIFLGKVVHYPDVRAIALTHGAFHFCYIAEDYSVTCRGDGDLGQTQVPQGLKAIALSAAGYHTCAIQKDHSVVCWGHDKKCQHCNRKKDPRFNEFSRFGCCLRDYGLKAIRFKAKNAVAVAAGNGNSCALLKNGKLTCKGKYASAPWKRLKRGVRIR